MWSKIIVASMWMWGITGGIAIAQQPEPPPDIALEIGVVQFFGNEPGDQLTLKAPAGDRLTLRFEKEGKISNIPVQEVRLEIVSRSLPEPILDEHVVLSEHRSYEDAEAMAKYWQGQGIEVELAQPDRWQVWAKRSAYDSPLVRRFLLESLQVSGDRRAYLKGQVVAKVPQASWKLGNYRYNRDQLEITAKTGKIQVVESGPEGINRLYAGKLRLQPNAYGNYTLVNDVLLETYLRGVVPHEIGGDAPDAALQAQAILARTYVLRNLHRFEADNYHLCADVNCQVYKGIGDTVARADQAIASTAGLVLAYGNELVDALYFSTSGGVTAAYTDVWEGEARPYLTAVLDSTKPVWDFTQYSLADEKNFRRFMGLKKGFNEDDWELFRWRDEASLESIAEFLKQYYRQKKYPIVFTRVQKVEVTERSTSGRVLRVKVTTDRDAIEIPKDEILTAFYPPISTLFYLDPLYKEDKKTLRGYAFVGGGFGHGVGLSQAGSYKLAESGLSGDRILQFYFPGTQLRSVADFEEF